MQTKTKSDFKAVDYMRKVRDELSILMQSDKKRFHDELTKAMLDFIAKRQKVNHTTK